MLTFVETSVFVEQIAELAGESQMELLQAIQDELLRDPKRGDTVAGLGGARKARVADPKRKGGKSGGLRYLYLYLELRGRVYLLYLYTKRERSDLNADQRKEIAALVDILKKAERSKR